MTINGRPYASLRRPLFQVGSMLEAAALHEGRSARNHLLCVAKSNGIGRRRVDEVLGMVGLTSVAKRRAGSSPWAWPNASGSASPFGRSGAVGFRRTGERSRPRGHRVDPHPDAVPGRRGADGVRLQPPDGRDGLDRGPCDRDRERSPAGRGQRRRIHRNNTQTFVRVRSQQSGKLAVLLGAWGGSSHAEPDGALAVTGMSAAAIGDMASARGIVVHELSPHQKYLPSNAAQAILSGGVGAGDDALSAWLGLGLFFPYAAAVLAVAAFTLVHRDA